MISSEEDCRKEKVDPAKAFDHIGEHFRDKRPQGHSMTVLFKAGDVIEHNTFDIGIAVSDK